MTTTSEPPYYRVRPEHREELADKTPVSEIMVHARDYWAAKTVTEEMVNRFLQWDDAEKRVLRPVHEHV